MISLAALVLTASVTALEPCSLLLADLGSKFKAWTPAARSIGNDYESHSYRAVTPQAITVTVIFTIAYGPEVGLREMRGFERITSCSMNGAQGALLFKRIVK